MTTPESGSPVLVCAERMFPTLRPRLNRYPRANTSVKGRETGVSHRRFGPLDETGASPDHGEIIFIGKEFYATGVPCKVFVFLSSGTPRRWGWSNFPTRELPKFPSPGVLPERCPEAETRPTFPLLADRCRLRNNGACNSAADQSINSLRLAGIGSAL